MSLSYRLRQHVKRPLRRRFPALFALALAGWHGSLGRRRSQGGKPLPRVLLERTKGKVAHGPFAGLAYHGRSIGSVSAAKLVGSYEVELHGLLAGLAERDFEVIVDVGCAEGYYAVGLARAFPSARVVAVDPLAPARRACARLAEDNGVADRLVTAAWASPARLQRWCRGRCLLLLDCEGAEEGILRPERAPALAGCVILVELHDFLDGGLSERVLARFRGSHRCTLVEQQPRDPAAWPVLEGLKPDFARRLLDEKRPRALRWALLEPLAAS
ncbi:MAG: class I SAM-dependent methyltransferase [Tistlia sp.]|uniref:hypothetical protein n=1 Tax=Tistlia sp. TaxID=3057121 RepID=UPI0034A13E31